MVSSVCSAARAECTTGSSKSACSAARLEPVSTASAVRSWMTWLRSSPAMPLGSGGAQLRVHALGVGHARHLDHDVARQLGDIAPVHHVDSQLALPAVG